MWGNRGEMCIMQKGMTLVMPFVTLSGFKPETFSSVVRCSIQLSYRAVCIVLNGMQM